MIQKLRNSFLKLTLLLVVGNMYAQTTSTWYVEGGAVLFITENTPLSTDNQIFKDSTTASTGAVMGNFKGFYVNEKTLLSGLHLIKDVGYLSNTSITRVLYDRSTKSIYIADGTVFSVLVNIGNNPIVAGDQTQVLQSNRKPFYKRNAILEKVLQEKSKHTNVAVFTSTGKGIWKHGCKAMAILQQGLSFTHSRLLVLSTAIPEYLFEEILPNGTKLTAKKNSYKKHFDRYTFSLPPPKLCFFCQDVLT